MMGTVAAGAPDRPGALEGVAAGHLAAEALLAELDLLIEAILHRVELLSQGKLGVGA